MSSNNNDNNNNNPGWLLEKFRVKQSAVIRERIQIPSEVQNIVQCWIIHYSDPEARPYIS
jgi:hypothetical protein